MVGDCSGENHFTFIYGIANLLRLTFSGY